jgi:hypothetical protein
LQPDKPVTAIRHGHEIILSAFSLVEDLSECRDVDLNVVFLDDETRPNAAKTAAIDASERQIQNN